MPHYKIIFILSTLSLILCTAAISTPIAIFISTNDEIIRLIIAASTFLLGLSLTIYSSKKIAKIYISTIIYIFSAFYFPPTFIIPKSIWTNIITILKEIYTLNFTTFLKLITFEILVISSRVIPSLMILFMGHGIYSLTRIFLMKLKENK